jgi:hypothetical protein
MRIRFQGALVIFAFIARVRNPMAAKANETGALS